MLQAQHHALDLRLRLVPQYRCLSVPVQLIANDHGRTFNTEHTTTTTTEIPTEIFEPTTQLVVVGQNGRLE